MRIKVAKLHPDAQLPEYATDGAACFDLRAVIEDRRTVLIDNEARPSATIRTGLAVEVPEGHVMLIYSRSGHGFKNDVRLANAVGVIDSDFRGEIQVKLTADQDGNLAINHGDRIAQAIILPYPSVRFEEVDRQQLSRTTRGAGGFGSTGSN